MYTDIDAYMVVLTMLIPCYLSIHVSHMQDPSVRIYIIATYAVHARPLLCKVYIPTSTNNFLASLLIHLSYLHKLTDSLHYILYMHTCAQAYRRGLHYPRHLLLTPAWYAQQWWLEEDQLSTCTPQQLESVLPTSLALLHFNFLQNNSMTTDTGIVNSGICLA